MASYHIFQLEIPYVSILFLMLFNQNVHCLQIVRLTAFNLKKSISVVNRQSNQFSKDERRWQRPTLAVFFGRCVNAFSFFLCWQQHS